MRKKSGWYVLPNSKVQHYVKEYTSRRLSVSSVCGRGLSSADWEEDSLQPLCKKCVAYLEKHPLILPQEDPVDDPEKTAVPEEIASGAFAVNVDLKHKVTYTEELAVADIHITELRLIRALLEANCPASIYPLPRKAVTICVALLDAHIQNAEEKATTQEIVTTWGKENL